MSKLSKLLKRIDAGKVARLANKVAHHTGLPHVHVFRPGTFAQESGVPYIIRKCELCDYIDKTRLV